MGEKLISKTPEIRTVAVDMYDFKSLFSKWVINQTDCDP